MILLWYPIGLLPLVAIGWMTVRALEGNTPVLSMLERIVYGSIFGPTLTLFVVFLAHIGGFISLTLGGFLMVMGVLIVGLGGILLLANKKCQGQQGRKGAIDAEEENALEPLRPWHLSPSHLSPSLSTWSQILLGILLVWTIVKVAGMALILGFTPSYQDDAFNNWNLRGKMYYVEERLVQGVENAEGIFASDGVHSYPPTVPLMKTWMATLAGRWEDGLAGIPHLGWYLSALALVYCILRRRTSLFWSLIGVYLLGSLPLYLVQGASPYADVFLSIHLLAAFAPLLFALWEDHPERRNVWLRIGALGAGLLVFTKNEALLLHLPPLAVITVGTLWYLRRTKRMTTRATTLAAAWYGILVCAVLLPWTLYKWSHGLTFGNAKSVSDLAFGWQPDVLGSLIVTYFFEANWLLLLPVLALLILWQHRAAFRSPLLLLTAFIGIVVFGQSCIFLFTGLSTEALMQTGSGRGIVHLLPVMVVLVVLILAGLLPRLGVRGEK